MTPWVPLHKPGALIRGWTPRRLKAEIDAASAGIKAALKGHVTVSRVNIGGKHQTIIEREEAEFLIRRKIGMMICADQIQVTLRPPPRDGTFDTKHSDTTPSSASFAARSPRINHAPGDRRGGPPLVSVLS